MRTHWFDHEALLRGTPVERSLGMHPRDDWIAIRRSGHNPTLKNLARRTIASVCGIFNWL